MNRDRSRDTGGRGRTHLPAAEAAPHLFRWIVDGHNAIFAVRDWEALQVAGQRREARLALEESLEAFGRAVGARITVVYDGNHLERNPDAVSWPHLRTEYSLPPEEADDRIRFLAGRAVRDGEQVVVVTSDRRTLAATLPAGVRWIDVRQFYRSIYQRALYVPEKHQAGDMEDIERHFLSLSPHEEDRRETSRRDPGDRDSNPGDRHGDGPGRGHGKGPVERAGDGPRDRTGGRSPGGAG
jgi:predicted RNA-binding protein with PIN domain